MKPPIRLFATLAGALLSAGLCTSTAAETKPATRPDAEARQSTTGKDPAEAKDRFGRKFLPVTKKEIEANRKLAQTWGDKTRDTIVKSMHLVETDHFLIYSAWNRSNDAALKQICERIYAALCNQFAIPRGQNIWAGKCPIYVFWEKEHFQTFCMDVDQVAKRSPRLLNAAGYNSHRGSFTYLVLNKVRTKRWFYELLVHEATHAFLARYLTNIHVVPWVNEGLADYMAAELVPGCWAKRKYVEATREAVRTKRGVAHVFNGVGTSAFDYGIAQSFVRYLIHRNRKAFIRFVTLLKEGKNHDQALQEAYGLTRRAFMKAWWKAVSRK